MKFLENAVVISGPGYHAILVVFCSHVVESIFNLLFRINGKIYITVFV